VLSSGLLGLALAYVAFQGVRVGPEPCVTVAMPPGSHEVASEWTWMPPHWDCVFYRQDENGYHEVGRTPVR
jgi:hypothetical protein